jgi:hypothetical protein
MRGPCWTLNHATEGIGRTYPQHQEMGPGYDYGASDSVHRLPYDALPDFEPNFYTVVIHGYARLTDLISSAPIRDTGLLVSGKLRAILEGFALPPHRFYPLPVVHRGKPVTDFFWLQLPDPALPLSETSTIEEFEQVIASAPQLAAMDLLRLRRPTRFAYCFVSDPLRRAIELAKITGVRLGRAKVSRSPSVDL